MIRMLKETAVLVIMGTLLAILANAVRANPAIKGHLSWGRNYFKRSVSPNNLQQAHPDSRLIDDAPTPRLTKPSTTAADNDASQDEQHITHDFQVISHKDVVALLDNPDTQSYINIFVDARNDEAFEQGHIPGAIQADHYELEIYVDDLMQFAPAAEKIVVYCNGGNCEDSIFMCQDLLELGIDKSAIFLYEGGWKAWEDSGAPIETGR